MGRPDKTEGSSIIYSHGISIQKHQEEALLDLLGIDTDEEEEIPDIALILGKISAYLGVYPGLVQSLDKAPTPAKYIREIGDLSGKVNYKTSLAYKAKNLLQNFCETSQWIYDAYTLEGYDLSDIERELGEFLDASSRVIETMKIHPESRGAPKKSALSVLINQLNDIFEKYYSIPDINEDELGERNRRDKRKTSGKQVNRNNFIEKCLDIAEINYPKNWTTLLYKEDGTPKIFLKQF